MSRRIDAEYASPAIERLRECVVKAGALPLSALTSSVRKGVQPERYIDDGPVRVIKSKDVNYPELDLDACETTDGTDWPYYLRGGEVLLNATGEGTLGRAGVVPANFDDERPMIPAVDVYVLEVDHSTVLPEYLALYLNSTIGRRLTASLQTGSSGQQHLYPVHFPLIPVPLPRTRSGRPDLGWQKQTIAIADTRVRALAAARTIGARLDEEFLDVIGTPVDLSMLPS
jgi:type I restriction enzyme S subunit